MGAKFYADPRHRYEFHNGAIGYRSGPSVSFDCLGPYAKVSNCPIEGTTDKEGNPLRLTCYATGYADTMSSIPACTKHRGKHVGGFFSVDSDGAVMFKPYTRFSHLLPMKAHGT